jgi:hypothetical protein
MTKFVNRIVLKKEMLGKLEDIHQRSKLKEKEERWKCVKKLAESAEVRDMLDVSN